MDSAVCPTWGFIKLLADMANYDQTVPKEQSDHGLHCLLITVLVRFEKKRRAVHGFMQLLFLCKYYIFLILHKLLCR